MPLRCATTRLSSGLRAEEWKRKYEQPAAGAGAQSGRSTCESANAAAGGSGRLCGTIPPPGATFISDTEVLEGARARRPGRLIQAVSTLLVLAALAMPVAAFRVAARLA